jgi:tetratricopeptide (TPR) repeat protein
VSRRRSWVPKVAWGLAGLALAAWGGPVAGQPSRAAQLDAQIAEGYRLLEAGQSREAEASFRAVLTADPKSLAAHEGLVWTHLRQGNLENAGRTADERLTLAPQDERWRVKRIEVIHQVPGRRDEAIAAARALVDAHPDALEPRLLLARILSWTKGRLAEAIAEYRKAIALAPQDLKAREELAQTLLWEGKYADAAAEYAGAVARAPGERGLRRGLGRTLSSAGRTSEAIRLFDELIREDPQDAEALFDRAQIARWGGDFETARRLMERTAAAGLENPQAAAELRDVARAARLRVASRDITLPLVVLLLTCSVVLGNTRGPITGRTYVTVLGYTTVLVSAGLAWLYRGL